MFEKYVIMATTSIVSVLTVIGIILLTRKSNARMERFKKEGTELDAVYYTYTTGEITKEEADKRANEIMAKRLKK